jgi:8-oxo-dGTP diphosphatase
MRDIKTISQKFPFCIPVVGAIVQRKGEDGIEILMQLRWKPERDPVYSGTWEFAIGSMDKPFESVYEALAREIREETGLVLKKIIGDSRTEIIKTNKEDAVFGFKPFCCVQQLKNGAPWVGFVFICEVEEGELKLQETEVKNAKWMSELEVEKIFRKTPENLFSLELPAWEYYFDKKWKGLANRNNRV